MDVFFWRFFRLSANFRPYSSAIFHPNTPHNFFCMLSAHDKWWFEQKKSPHFREKYLVLSYLKEKIKHWFPCRTLLRLPFLLLRWPLPLPRQCASHPTSSSHRCCRAVQKSRQVLWEKIARARHEGRREPVPALPSSTLLDCNNLWGWNGSEKKKEENSSHR